VTAATVPPQVADVPRESPWPHRLSSARLTALAILSALLVGAVIVAVSDIDNVKTLDVGGMWQDVVDSYRALASGAIGSWRAWSETITAATPLIFAGLAVAIAFKAGLFNIGATGQMLAGGMAAVWVGFAFEFPAPIHVLLAIAAAIVAGAIWGGLVGVLKARTGAHEVITTIMLNYVAGSLVLWLLKTTAFQRPGRGDPISKEIKPSSHLPNLFWFLDKSSLEIRAHTGFVLAILVAAFVSWLMTKSKLGFQFRTLGANADAARYAGMNPGRLTIGAMMFAGAFAGLGGASEILGGVTQNRATVGFAGDVGFDAIAVALLGRSSPWGTTAAALLFGALKAGGDRMQATTGVPVDLVLVIRALIVLFVAAPALTRGIWRMKHDGGDSGTQLFRGWGS
jgi:ABC-type uncharacterized transport system permease subunit